MHDPLDGFLPLRVNSYAQEGDWTKKSAHDTELPDDYDEIPFYLWEKYTNDPYIKDHFGFKIAFCQHPMYLLIDEDRGEPTVGERIPPWGAATSDEYVKRVRRNLSSLVKYPDLRLNYQWSAYELNHMVTHSPDVHEEMKRLYGDGSLDFLDGTFSQAHLQVLGSESNWRQFEYGLEIYKKQFDKKVDVYARQETGLHRQLPQLLSIFGYRYMTLPSFHSVINFHEGSLEFMYNDGQYLPLGKQEFINASSLDGSIIPAYLWMTPGEWEDRTDQFEMDLYSGPKIFYEFPDLEEIDMEDYDDFIGMYDWVILGDALDERILASPPTASADIYSYWSYMEGVWAEELMRTNKLAEEQAVLAEQVMAMGEISGAGTDHSAKLKSIWLEILKSQHHDISWIEVTDLRRKSITRLQQAIVDCNLINDEVSRQFIEKDSRSMAFVNGLPYSRKSLVEFEPVISFEGLAIQEFKGKSLGFVDLTAGGVTSYKKGKKASKSISSEAPAAIQTDHYSVEITESGLIRQIRLGEKELLTTENYLGGELRARLNGQWVDNREAEIEYYSGPVCDIIERKSSLGHIPVKETYYFFKERPVIRALLEFEFHGDEVGNMWIDETKINVYYPTTGENVYNDIPFGYVEAMQERPIFATNWVYSGGLVYINRGTLKHRVEDGVIANVLAWGSNHYSNRLHFDYWTTQAQFDIKLYGNQSIEYYLIPTGSFDGNAIVKEVQALIAPVYMTPGKGDKSFYSFDYEDIAVTAIYKKNDLIWLRGYELPDCEHPVFKDWEIVNFPLK